MFNLLYSRVKVSIPFFKICLDVMKGRCCVCRSRIEKVNYRQKEKQVLDSILGKGYDKRIRPSGKNDTGNLLLLIPVLSA